MDYTFNEVNPTSLLIAPCHAMQFGQALQRILQSLVYANPQFGPPLLAKLDLADGFYRVPLSPIAALQLAVVLPPDAQYSNLIGIPLSLPMGWALSPPYFCAYTETCADLANLAHPHNPPAAHPLENTSQLSPLPIDNTYASGVPFPWNTTPPLRPLQQTDVYLDDFLLMAQRPRHRPALRSTLHAIDTVFADTPDSPRRHIISASKLAKGDATWAHEKRILGWDINTKTMTLHLPPHRLQRLEALLRPLLTQARISRNRWLRILGELRSMAMALHSAKYMFSILQHALVDQRGRRLRLNKLVSATIADWLQLAKDSVWHKMESG
jgi:hypothetical protein